MKNELTHTPTPWLSEQALRQDGKPIPYSWNILATIEPPPGVDESFMHVAETHTERNAAFICCAVNSHDALVDALKAAVARVELANDEGNPILSAWLPDARAALKLADGKE